MTPSGLIVNSMDSQTELAREIASRSVRQWGDRGAVVLIGRSTSFVESQVKLLQFAQADSPILITGETGTGKELFARAAYLLSARRRRSFLSVNCAQFQGGELMVSELFGHRKGSFTGALADRRGVFEEADLGMVFLDEVAELTPTAQAMLLRTLGEGEVVRLGENQPRLVDVRVVAATSGDLRRMVKTGAFRRDLYFRLRFMQLRIPPLAARRDDCLLAAHYYLDRMNAGANMPKWFSEATLQVFRQYAWPGNLRELQGVVEVGFHVSDGPTIEPDHVAEGLEDPDAAEPQEQPKPVNGSLSASLRGPPGVNGNGRFGRSTTDRYLRMLKREGTFWDVVHKPFMDRDLNRTEARDIVARGLEETRGSYKKLLPLFGIVTDDYLRFMDFLRHHRLKPKGMAPLSPHDALARLQAERGAVDQRGHSTR